MSNNWGNGSKWLFSTATSLGSQLLAYAVSQITGSASNPQTTYVLSNYALNLVILTIGKLSPGLASASWLPTVIQIVAGWIAVGSIFFLVLVLLIKVIKVGLVLAIVILVAVVIGGFALPHVPVPTNSTLPAP